MGQSHESTVSDSQLHSLYDVLPMLMVTATNSHEAVSLSVAVGQFTFASEKIPRALVDCVQSTLHSKATAIDVPPLSPRGLQEEELMLNACETWHCPYSDVTAT